MSENIKPVTHQYLFTSPFVDREVWRDNQAIWNGQYAKQSRPLYDQSAIEAARQEGREAVLAELREKGTCVEADLRRQLAALQIAVDAFLHGDCSCSEFHASYTAAIEGDTSAIDALLAAKERETLERCAKICELALSSEGTTPADCLYSIRAMLKNETSCTQS